jgi:two-component system, LytTR family, sensor kinase
MSIRFINNLLQLMLWLFFYYTVVVHYIEWLPTVGMHFSLLKIYLYSLVYVICLSILPYVNNLFLLDRFYRKGKRTVYYILIVAGTALSLCLFVVVDYVFTYPDIPYWFFIPLHFLSRLPYVLIFTFVIYLFKMRHEFYDQQGKQLQLEKEKTEAELQFLKAQINPHFLFNTLNNIQSLAFTQPEKASTTIVNLANLFRYISYDGKREQVTLLEEINYIKNYLALSVMKKSWMDKVTLEVKDIDPNVKLEPLLLINFIENAFKHGSLEDATDFISIRIATDDQKIIFHCSNTFVTSNSTSGHIGLENVIRRLDLVYPKKYELQTTMVFPVYHVNLTITYEN